MRTQPDQHRALCPCHLRLVALALHAKHFQVNSISQLQLSKGLDSFLTGHNNTLSGTLCNEAFVEAAAIAISCVPSKTAADAMLQHSGRGEEDFQSRWKDHG